jgi:hypothetical protein
MVNFFKEQTSVEHGANPKKPTYINGVNSVHTGFVQVPLQLHRRLLLHVVLEEAAAERGPVVGFRDGVLTAVFIRVSVTEVEMIRMRRSCPPSASSSAASPCKSRSKMISLAESVPW